MSKEVLERAFEPFFTTKGLGKGTGLGLAAVYGIITQHDGWVNLYSEPGKGTSFKIYLPVCPDEEMRDEAYLESDQRRAPAQGHGERILIVEDEVSIQTLAARVLSDKCYEVSVAGTAREALSTFHHENGRFDLLMSDVVLPDRSGLDLVEEIRAQRPDLPILLCSGYTDERSHWDTISEKGFHYLQKPYPLAVLLNTVQTILSRPRADY
jgi:two-component system, cell cycle sensor histidine kinase and response regulator CckA